MCDRPEARTATYTLADASDWGGSSPVAVRPALARVYRIAWIDMAPRVPEVRVRSTASSPGHPLSCMSVEHRRATHIAALGDRRAAFVALRVCRAVPGDRARGGDRALAAESSAEVRPGGAQPGDAPHPRGDRRRHADAAPHVFEVHLVAIVRSLVIGWVRLVRWWRSSAAMACCRQMGWFQQGALVNFAARMR